MASDGNREHADDGIPSPRQLKRYQIYRDLLVKGRQTAETLAGHGGVGLRQFGRDSTLLRDSYGWEIEYCAVTRCWKAVGSMPLPLLSLAADEAMALLLAEPALAGYGVTPFGAALHRAFRKVSESLDVPLPPDPPVGFELPALRHTDPYLLTRIARAAAQHERLRMTYVTAETGERKQRTVDPYLIFNHSGGWYLAGYCHTRQRLTDFSISGNRIETLVNTAAYFTPDPALDLDAYRQGGFGIFKGGVRQDVVLRFAGAQAFYQNERIPHPAETREPQADGSLIIRLSIPVNIGIKRWVLQYGSEVEVLEPPDLRDWVREQAAVVAGRGGDG